MLRNSEYNCKLQASQFPRPLAFITRTVHRGLLSRVAPLCGARSLLGVQWTIAGHLRLRASPGKSRPAIVAFTTHTFFGRRILGCLFCETAASIWMPSGMGASILDTRSDRLAARLAPSILGCRVSPRIGTFPGVSAWSFQDSRKLVNSSVSSISVKFPSSASGSIGPGVCADLPCPLLVRLCRGQASRTWYIPVRSWYSGILSTFNHHKCIFCIGEGGPQQRTWIFTWANHQVKTTSRVLSNSVYKEHEAGGANTICCVLPWIRVFMSVV